MELVLGFYYKWLSMLKNGMHLSSFPDKDRKLLVIVVIGALLVL